MVEVSDPAYSVTIVTWRDTVTASASVRWFHAYDEVTTTVDIVGFAQVEEFVRRLPVAAKLTLIDVYDTSAPLVDHLRRAGWTLDVRHVTDLWRVSIECYPTGTRCTPAQTAPIKASRPGTIATAQLRLCRGSKDSDHFKASSSGTPIKTGRHSSNSCEQPVFDTGSSARQEATFEAIRARNSGAFASS